MSGNSRQLAITALAAGLLLSATAAGSEYYVATTGSDSNSGSLTAPFATLAKASSVISAGDTVWVRGGVYYLTTQLLISTSGTSEDKRTRIWAYPGEKPVLDASRYVTTNPAIDATVVLVTGSWMHIKGLEIANARPGKDGDHSYSLLGTRNASNNIFELLELHHGFGTGLFINGGLGGNLILNCDSHDNYDRNGSQGDGQNADGFGVHYQTAGASTVIRGSRAWMNSDDGYDYIHQEVPVLTEGNFAMKNGYGSSGNGNGFKMGSSGTGIRHIIRNNVAWRNKAAGFYANHSSGGNTWENNSSYNNGVQFDMRAATFAADGRTIAIDDITLTGSKVHILRGNVGYPDRNRYMNGVDSAGNSWDATPEGLTAETPDTADDNCTAPREANGSLPVSCKFTTLTHSPQAIRR